MRKEVPSEVLRAFEAELKKMGQDLLERLMHEEREIYLENHPPKANGYYTRDPLTPFGPIQELRVPRGREGNFHPKLLPRFDSCRDMPAPRGPTMLDPLATFVGATHRKAGNA